MYDWVLKVVVIQCSQQLQIRFLLGECICTVVFALDETSANKDFAMDELLTAKLGFGKTIHC